MAAGTSTHSSSAKRLPHLEVIMSTRRDPACTFSRRQRAMNRLYDPPRPGIPAAPAAWAVCFKRYDTMPDLRGAQSDGLTCGDRSDEFKLAWTDPSEQPMRIVIASLQSAISEALQTARTSASSARVDSDVLDDGQTSWVVQKASTAASIFPFA